MRSSVSIALFFLLSGFFLFALLAAIERSRKALALAGACLVAVVCIIVFLTPVRLPDWIPGVHNGDPSTTTTNAPGVTTSQGSAAVTTHTSTTLVDLQSLDGATATENAQ